MLRSGTDQFVLNAFLISGSIRFRFSNRSNWISVFVAALKHSPSKRKSLSRPLRPHEELDSNSKYARLVRMLENRFCIKSKQFFHKFQQP
jgi:hypothetical protein